MDDLKCGRILTEIRNNTAKATRYEYRDRDVEALDYAINVFRERIIKNSNPETAMYDRVKKVFESHSIKKEVEKNDR